MSFFRRFKLFKSEPIVVMVVAIVALLMVVRASTDHSRNFHYTGDNYSETLLLSASNNFHEFGYLGLRLMPVHELPSTVRQAGTESPSLYYTHYGALPYWILSVPFNLFGQNEFAARLFVICLSFLGLFFAVKAVREITAAIGLERDKRTHALFSILILTLTPAFLCYGDTLYSQPIEEALKWYALYWAVLYLSGKASWRPAAVLLFLFVWISFEWWIPMLAVVAYCLWLREGQPRAHPWPWVAVFGIGFVGAVGLRLFHNALVLGGVENTIRDLTEIGRLRFGSHPVSNYSVLKHAGKLAIGTYWFVGMSPLILPVAAWPLWKKLFRQRMLNRQMLGLLVIWGIGAMSWPFLMRQHSEKHAWTYLHIANAILLFAAISAAMLWAERRRWMVVVCLGLQVFSAGALVHAEIWLPFVKDSTRYFVSKTCPQQRSSIMVSADSIHSSVADLIKNELSKVPSPSSAVSGGQTPCSKGSVLSGKILMAYLYLLKSTSFADFNASRDAKTGKFND